jgi:hypothetical protein
MCGFVARERGMSEGDAVVSVECASSDAESTRRSQSAA